MRFVTAILTSFLVPVPVFASVVISEVMYDLSGTDTKREWVEITNVSSGTVDLTEVVFFEANTSHKIKAFEGGTQLSPGSAAIIALDTAKFKEDNPTYSGVLVDSSWSSLSNDGEELEIRDSTGTVLDRIAYAKDQGAAGNGTSLERNGNSFRESTPTPGVAPSSLPSPLAQIQSPVVATPPAPAQKVDTEIRSDPKPKTAQDSVSEPVQVQEEIKATENVPQDAVLTEKVKVNAQQKAEEAKTVNKKTDDVPTQARTAESSKTQVLLEQETQEGVGADDSLTAQVGSVETSGNSVWLYVLALVALLGVAGTGVLLTAGGAKGSSGSNKTKEADSYTIVE